MRNLGELNARGYRVAIEGACKKAGIPKRYEMVMLTRRAEPDFDYVDELTDGRGLFIHGKVGTGKTELACRIAAGYQLEHSDLFSIGDEYIVRTRKTVRFVVATNLLSEIKSTYDSKDGSEEAVMAKYTKCDLLVLDDLGGKEGNVTPWVASKLWQLINDRYNSLKSTVVTTQYSAGELGGKLCSSDEDSQDAVSMISRLIETCRDVKLEGRDHRLANRRCG